MVKLAACKLICPSCGSKLAVELEEEIQAVGCDCSHIFLAQHPDTLKGSKKKPAKKAAAPLPPLSLPLLEAADDVTSAAVIEAFAKDAVFKKFAKAETQGIVARDAEDDEKLAQGIKAAIAKGAVPPMNKIPLEPLKEIDVHGKTADDVALEIVTALGDAPKRGCVLVLQGLSGTGKGTTVAKLQRMLPRASAWSNGNIFRALTLLAVTYCESHGLRFGPEVLSAQLLAELMGCLHFEKKAGSSSQPGAAVEFDVRIDGLGIRAMVSQVANTLLKEPKVSQNIPTVAKVTQGEVIAFAAKCAETMRAAGCNVLMEGRAQTLNYVRTPHRFELILSKPLTIGLRRAAQRVVGSATPALQKAAAAQGGKAPPPSEEVVLTALVAALDQLTA